MKLHYHQRLAAAADTQPIPDLYQLIRDLDGFALIQIIFDPNDSDQNIIRVLKTYINQLKQHQAAFAEYLSGLKNREIKDIISNQETLIRYVPKRFDGTEEIRTITYCIDYIERAKHRAF